MRAACFSFLIFLFVMSGLGAAHAATYHVGVDLPGASDSNNGQSRESAFKTLGRAMEAAGPGDTILMYSGTYNESDLRFARSGEPGMPITIAAAQNEFPSLYGSGQRGSGILIEPGQGHYVFDGLTITNMGGSGIATDDSTSQTFPDITVKNCTLSNNGWCGLELNAVDGFTVDTIVAEGNGFYGLNIGASKDGDLSSSNGVVRNSRFANHTGEEGHGMAINQGHHIEVTGCRAEHNRVHGFDVSDWPKEGEVSHHVTFEANVSTDNGVAGFCVNSDSHHVLVVRNIAFRNGAAWGGHGSSSGFLSYEGLWEAQFINNVSVGNSDRGFDIVDPAGHFVRADNNKLSFINNITLDNGNPDWDECFGLYVCQGPWELDIRSNNWAGCPSNEHAGVMGLNMNDDQGLIFTEDEVPGYGHGNVSVDPEFADPSGGDFRLRDGSPMIDAGADVGRPFEGAAPDMGAYER